MESRCFGKNEMGKTRYEITCSEEEIRKIGMIARSRTAGIWRIKRAKIILGALEGRNIDQLVLDVRVPPETIKKFLKNFPANGLKSLDKPDRKPTSREVPVEKMLIFLEQPAHPGSKQWDRLEVHYIGHEFSARQIKKIRNFIASNPTSTRGKIACWVCTAFGLYQSNGKLKETGVSAILKRMDMDNIILLPPVPSRMNRNHSSVNRPTPKPRKTICLDVSELRTLQFIPVKTRKDASLWRNLIADYHYIGGYRLFGAQMRYLVYGGEDFAHSIKRPDNQGNNVNALKKPSGKHPVGDRGKHDTDRPRGKHLLGVLGFAASSWRLFSRDRFIGWSNEQRIANLNLVVNNVRFLILPWIKSPNLASRILGGITRRLPFDWEARYGFKPVLLETFVDLSQFRGTCYRAANWIQVGITEGYSLYGIEQKKKISKKAILLYPLCKNFRDRLCNPP
ncbi:MAG: hypothetical protein BA868_04780 [Desulfobacterales bacterium C00003106]|nr:MAG: hypothetical protein BA868_04780 [Desulfobacterales bacterium C00003106]